MRAVRIVRLAELADTARARGEAEAEAIFWETAGTTQFADDAGRAAYRDLWFGRYLAYAPEAFFLAMAPDDTVLGYLAGSFISDAAPLAGPDYYPLFPPELVARHPAHIHVNVRADSRSGGIGAGLIEAFAGHCRARRLPGLHAVTAAQSRSAAFFAKCGLVPSASATWRGRSLAFLARGL